MVIYKLGRVSVSIIYYCTYAFNSCDYNYESRATLTGSGKTGLMAHESI